jgi:hypothetical protein
VKSQKEVYRTKAKEYARLTSYKIAAGEPSIPETRRNVLGTRAGRKTRERSTFKNDRENEPDMTTYPLEFHRRCEQKWVLRAQASSACESTPRAALVGRSRRGQRRSTRPNVVTSLARRAWLRALRQWHRAEYNAADQPVPKRLAALRKEPEGRRL